MEGQVMSDVICSMVSKIKTVKGPPRPLLLQLGHFSHVQIFETLWTVSHQLLWPWDFPGKNNGVSCHFLFQGIFLTQGLNPHRLHLLHQQADSSPLHHLANGKILELLMFFPFKLKWKEWVMAERPLRDSVSSWSRARLPMIETYLCCSLELLITQTSLAI